MSLAELAIVASDVTGDDYRYQPEDDDWWEGRWRSHGKPDWGIEAGRTSFEALRRGEFDIVTDDYRTITGRDPLTVAQIIERHADEMPLRSGLGNERAGTARAPATLRVGAERSVRRAAAGRLVLRRRVGRARIGSSAAAGASSLAPRSIDFFTRVASSSVYSCPVSIMIS